MTTIREQYIHACSHNTFDGTSDLEQRFGEELLTRSQLRAIVLRHPSRSTRLISAIAFGYTAGVLPPEQLELFSAATWPAAAEPSSLEPPSTPRPPRPASSPTSTPPPERS